MEEQEPCRPRATVLLLGNTTDTPWADYLGGAGAAPASALERDPPLFSVGLQVDEAIQEALAEARAELPLEEEVEEVEGRPQ